MKYNFEMEPAEFDALCSCMSHIFDKWAESETASSMSNQLMEKFIDKLENLPQQEEQVLVDKPKKVAPAKKKEVKMGFDTVTEEKDFCEV